MKKLFSIPLAAAVAFGAACTDGPLPLAPSDAVFHEAGDPCHNLPVPGGLATVAGSASVLVTWSPLDCSGSSFAGAGGYDLQFEQRVDAAWVLLGPVVPVAGASTAQHTETDLDDGEYRVRLRARAAAGGTTGAHHSEWSAWNEFEIVPTESYFLVGFFSPVSDGMTVKGGSTVPLKFQVFEGTPEEPGAEVTGSHERAGDVAVSLATTVCGGAGGAGDPIDLGDAGSTSLRYDEDGGQWIRNWKTPKAPSCYAVTASLGSAVLTVQINTR